MTDQSDLGARPKIRGNTIDIRSKVSQWYEEAEKEVERDLALDISALDCSAPQPRKRSSRAQYEHVSLAFAGRPLEHNKEIVPQPTVTLLRTFDPCHLSEYGHLGEEYGHLGEAGGQVLGEKSESDGEGHLREEEAAANRLYGRLGHQPDRDGDGVEDERPPSGASGGQRPPAPRPRKNLPAAAKKINFGPLKPPRNFNYALLGREGEEGDSEACEKPKKAKEESAPESVAVKGKKGGKSKVKLQLEELGRMRGKGRKGERKEILKGERKDSLKGDLEGDAIQGLAVENLYVTLPLPPSNQSSPEKRFVIFIVYSSLFSHVIIDDIFAAATIQAPRKALDPHRSLPRLYQHPAHHQVLPIIMMIYYLMVNIIY